MLGESAERDVTVETRTVRAVFTNRGARLRHWILKHYLDDEGQPLDLVPAADSVNNALMPFSLRLDSAEETSLANGGLFRTSASGTLDATTGPVTLFFEWQNEAGLAFVKQFTLQPDGYIVELMVKAQRGGEAVNAGVDWGPGLGDDIAHASPGSFLAPSYSTPAQAPYHGIGR